MATKTDIRMVAEAIAYGYVPEAETLEHYAATGNAQGWSYDYHARGTLHDTTTRVEGLRLSRADLATAVEMAHALLAGND